MLDSVVVAAPSVSWRVSEFDDRRKFGLCQYMTQAEIDKKGRSWTADLFRTFRSVTVVSSPRGEQFAMNRRGMAPCSFQVFLDGAALPMPTDLNNLPTPRNLAGIEVYLGPATIPLQYKTPSGGAACGVILVWTRVGT